MRKHYERILYDSESRVQRYLEIQILDENSPFCGGFPKADSLAEPKTAIYRDTTMTACYLNPESRYYLDAELGRRLALALAFVRRSQRPGGYFDLINCNFFSGPDTAFCTKRLLPAYRRYKQMVKVALVVSIIALAVCLLTALHGVLSDGLKGLKQRSKSIGISFLIYAVAFLLFIFFQ